jgi:hypothetical protein
MAANNLMVQPAARFSTELRRVGGCGGGDNAVRRLAVSAK